jgi:hypothetical protein
LSHSSNRATPIDFAARTILTRLASSLRNVSRRIPAFYDISVMFSGKMLLFYDIAQQIVVARDRLMKNFFARCLAPK